MATPAVERPAVTGAPVAAPPADAPPPPSPTPRPRPPPAAPAPAKPGGGGWGVPLAVLITGMFMSVLDISIVNVAIPTMQIDFSATTEEIQWVANGLLAGVGRGGAGERVVLRPVRARAGSTSGA